MVGQKFFRHPLIVGTALVCSGVLAACAVLPRNAVPETLIDDARVPGLPRIRYWGDETLPDGAGVLQNIVRQNGRAERVVITQAVDRSFQC